MDELPKAKQNIKRIAMISYHTCPLASEEGKETGGMNVYVLALAQELAQQGWLVDIFTRREDADNPPVVQIAPNLRLLHIPAGPPVTIPKKELGQFLPEFIENYEQFVAAEKIQYDILHCHYYLSGLAGLEIQERIRSQQKDSMPPVVMTFHTLALMKNLVARTELEKEDMARIDAEMLLTKRAQKIVAPSESELRYLEYLYEVFPSKVAVIPPGVDTELFRPLNRGLAKRFIQADPTDKIILFVGRIEPLKGIDGLIYAIKILTQKLPSEHICLWIVGGDTSQKLEHWSAELQKLEQLREVLKIPGIVKFVGQRPQHELPYYYNAAEVVVMPSHYESFGMAAVEAMACGVPVITTNVAGVSTLLDEKHKAFLTTVNNPLLLASQIEHILLDKRKHAEVAAEIYDRVQDLNWPTIAGKVGEVYEDLLHLSPRASAATR